MSGNGSLAQFAMAVAGIVLDGDGAPRAYARGVGEGSAQARGCRGEVAAAGRSARVRFALPGRDESDFVSLAIPVLPGIYAIEQVELGGTSIDDLARRVVSAHERLGPASAPNQLRLSSDSGPPTLELDLRGLPPQADGDRTLEIRLRRESSSDAARHLAARVDDLAHAGMAMQRHVGGVLLGQSQRLERLLESVVGLEARMASIESALSRRIDAFETAFQDRLEPLAAEVRTLAEAEAVTAARQADALSTLASGLDEVQARTGRLLGAVENVFWRRWLRRLRRRAP